MSSANQKLARQDISPHSMEEIERLNESAFHERHLNPTSSLEMTRQALRMSTDLGYTKGIAKALLNIGFQELTQSQYDKAFATFTQSLGLFQEIEYPPGIAHAFYNLGVLYQRLGNYENAMDAQQESLAIRIRLEDQDGIASCKSQTGYLNAQFGLLEKSFSDYEECIAIWRKNGNMAGLAAALMALGNIKLNLNKLGEAKQHLIESLRIRKAINEVTGWLGSTNYLADVYLKEGNTREALVLLDEALLFALSQENPFAPGVCRLRTNIAKVYIQLGDTQNARVHLEKALALALDTKQQYQVHDIYFELSRLHKLSSTYQMALEYYEKFHESKQKVISLNAATKLKNLEMLNKVEIREKEIEIHRLKNIELRDRNKIIREERKKSDTLLLNILPHTTARELKKNGNAKTRQYKLATILFTDFVNFTAIAEKLSPEQLVASIHTYFSAFDEIITRNNIEKIKTIGDAYMATGGVPMANTTNPVQVVTAALEIVEYVKAQNDARFRVRVGVHTGSVIAGVVGRKKFAYDIWGDAVNIAARMESSGEVGKVNISGATYELIKDQFNCFYRGKIEAKNKGMIDMYFVSGHV